MQFYYDYTAWLKKKDYSVKHHYREESEQQMDDVVSQNWFLLLYLALSCGV